MYVSGTLKYLKIIKKTKRLSIDKLFLYQKTGEEVEACGSAFEREDDAEPEERRRDERPRRRPHRLVVGNGNALVVRRTAVREELLLRTEAGAAGDSWSKCRLLRVPLVDGLEVLVASAAGCAQHRRYAVAASLPARMEPENRIRYPGYFTVHILVGSEKSQN